eukprot:scaffold133870_cov20-Tisochrysis_lutea.AAC.1
MPHFGPNQPPAEETPKPVKRMVVWLSQRNGGVGRCIIFISPYEAVGRHTLWTTYSHLARAQGQHP